MSVEIHKAGSALLPSLGPDETEQISRKQGEFGQALRNTLNNAKSRGAHLAEALELSRLYKAALNAASTAIERATFSDEPVTSLGGLHFNLDKIDHAIRDIKVQIHLFIYLSSSWW